MSATFPNNMTNVQWLMSLALSLRLNFSHAAISTSPLYFAKNDSAPYYSNSISDYKSKESSSSM